MRWINSETGVGISVDDVPGRKSQGLFVVIGNEGFKVGNVTDPDAFINAMNEMLKPFMEEE